ncbi:MAG: DUF2067 family protein [Fervidicoccaceae archaeon]
MRKRKLVLKVPREPEKALELIAKAVQAQLVSYRLRGNKLEITLRGDEISLARSVDNVKRALASLRLKDQAIGVTFLPKGRLAEVLGRAVPLEALKELLSALKISYEDRGGELIVRSSVEELRKHVLPLSELLEASSTLCGGAAREVVAVAAHLTELDPAAIVEIGKGAGVLVESKDGRIFLGVDRRRALEELLRAASRRSEESGRSMPSSRGRKREDRVAS